MCWVAVVAAGAALPSVAALAAGRTLSWRDTARLFGPVRPLVVEALRDLRLPLWNPHEALGIPLFAQAMHGVLHPLSLLLAWAAPGAGMDAFVLGHVVAAAVGAALLARQLGASSPASAVGGLAFGLSGYVLGMSGILTYLAAAGVAPWAVAGVRASGGGSRAGLIAGGLGVAVSFLAGDPQWTAVAAGLGIALAGEAHGVRGLGRATLATIAGTALAGIQLVPTGALFLEARRRGGLSPLERQMWALAPWRTLELLAPGFFGGIPGQGAPVFARLGGPSEYAAPFAQSVFVGAVPFALAAAGVPASRVGRLLGAGALLLLWIALGTRGGADQVLRHVPAWGSFRYAEKMIGPFTLCVSMLAALGADRIASSAVARPALVPGGAAALTGLAAAGLALWARVTTDPGALVAVRLAVGLGHAAAGLALLSIALWMVRRRPGAAGHFPAIAAGLVLAQGIAAAPFALHLGRPGVVEGRPLLALRTDGSTPRIAVPVQGIVEKMPVSLDEADWLMALQSRMGEAAFNVPSRIDQVATYTGLEPRRHGAVFGLLRREFGPSSWAAWRRFGLTHVVVNQVAAFDPEQGLIAARATEGGRPVLDDEWGFTVWQVPHRPWAGFATRAVQAPSEAEARRLLVEMLATAGDGAVVVEGPGRPTLAPGRILAARREPEALRIDAESDGDALLVVNDAYWPGWEATLDGRAVAVQPADALVRAVTWPAGRHVLEMRYLPWEVRVGWLCSAGGAVLIIGLALRPRRPSRE